MLALKVVQKGYKQVVQKPCARIGVGSYNIDLPTFYMCGLVS